MNPSSPSDLKKYSITQLEICPQNKQSKANQILMFFAIFIRNLLNYPHFGRNTAMRVKFHARQTSRHSPRTLSRPRSEN